MQLLLKTLIISTMLAGSVMAAELPDFDAMSHEQRREAMKSMTPEQREAFHKARKAKWEAMSKDEKLKLIEEKRAKFKTEREAEWNSMSDDEKIKHAEKRMQQKGKKHHGEEHGRKHKKDD